MPCDPKQPGTRVLRGREVTAEDVLVYGAFGVATGIFTLWSAFRAWAKERALPPGSPTAMNLRKAISTGQLPEEASAEQWEPELIRILIQERHMAWFGPLMCGLFTALGVFLILDSPERPWLGVICSPLFLGLTVWYPFWVRRRRVRIQELLAQFPEEESLWR